MQHGIAVVFVAAFSMYQECCEGRLNSDWFVPEKERLNIRAFRLKFPEQQLKYWLQNREYPGDIFFRRAT